MHWNEWCMEKFLWRSSGWITSSISIKAQPATDKPFCLTGNGEDYSWGYAFDAKGCRITPDGGGSDGEKYGKDCVAGDVIEMVLDLALCIIKYIINNHDYGVMHTVKKTKYRPGTSIEMLWPTHSTLILAQKF